MEQQNQQEKNYIVDYKQLPSQETEMYFYYKYQKELLNLLFKKITNTFYSVPIEKNDLCYIIWQGIKETLMKYNVSNERYSFKAAVFQTCISKSYRMAKSFLTNGHHILNNAISTDKLNLLSHYATSYEDDNSSELVDMFIFLEQLYKIKSKHMLKIKSIIYFKSLGYKNVEIAQELKITRSQVEYLLRKIREAGQAFLQNKKYFYKIKSIIYKLNLTGMSRFRHDDS